jgi:hypothetical protein
MATHDTTDVPQLVGARRKAQLRQWKAKEIIALIGADSVEHFNKVVRSIHGTCPYRKCYPARTPLKPATFEEDETDASLVRRSECNNVHCVENNWMEFLRTTADTVHL